MGKLFANFEPYDVQETRRLAKEEEAENGIRIMVLTLKELNFDQKIVARQLTEHYNLSEETAMEKIKRYW